MEILEERETWLAEFRQGWLAKLEATGETDWKIYHPPRNQFAPSGQAVRLAESRLMLITSAGSYLAESQPPFEAANLRGDYTLREFPSTTRLDELAFAHEHYDHTKIDQDPQVAVPLRLLEEMVTAGQIGELADIVTSMMGYQPEATRTVDEVVPRIVEIAQAEHVQAALLAPV